MSRLLGFITQLSCLLARDLEQMTSSIDPLGFPDSSVRKESTCNVRDTSLIPGSGRSAGEGISYPLQFSWASLVAQLVKNLPVMQETWVNPWIRKIPWRRERLPTPVFWPGDFHGLYSPWGHKELDRLNNFHFLTARLFNCEPFSATQRVNANEIMDFGWLCYANASSSIIVNIPLWWGMGNGDKWRKLCICGSRWYMGNLCTFLSFLLWI